MACSVSCTTPDPFKKVEEEEEEEEEEEGQWKCPLCLEAFKNPKLLPCAHTFCEECLQNLVKHRSSRHAFPCPSCREQITVPKGGVSAFKNNFYLQEPAKESRGPLCQNQKHTKDREIELFCLDCRLPHCLECKMTLHYDHNTEDIMVTAESFKARLVANQFGLKGVMGELKSRVQEFREEQKAVQDKREALKKDILHRHQLMVEVANRCRDEAIFSLDTVSASIDSQLCLVLKDLQKTLDDLGKLHKRMEMCVKGEKGHGLLVTAEDIYADAARYEKDVDRQKATRVTQVSRPVLNYSAPTDAVNQTLEKFLGPVVRLDMDVGLPVVTVREVFRCRQEPSSHNDVFSLFPRVDDKIWIAYESGSDSDGSAARHPELYDLHGTVTDMESSICGRSNFTHTTSGTGMCIQKKQGFFSTYAKSRSLHKLKNNLKGDACVISIIVKSESPLQTLKLEAHNIKCGPHRAFDVDEQEVYFAVVEEGQGLNFARQVHIYQHPDEKPVATYTPPSPTFQPTDVCFYTLAGRQVLLVADEASDGIHVVEMVKGRLQFVRYLTPGCPIMLQPKALNTDVKGNLWVACKNGSVLLCEPVLYYG